LFLCIKSIEFLDSILTYIRDKKSDIASIKNTVDEHTQSLTALKHKTDVIAENRLDNGARKELRTKSNREIVYSNTKNTGDN
jgi:hypothetical protein